MQNQVAENTTEQDATQNISPKYMYCSYLRYKDKFQVTTLSQIQFIKLTERRKKESIWKEVLFLQIIIHNPKYKIDTIRIKFDKELVNKNCEYFERAARETLIILEKIPRASVTYVSQDAEDAFLERLRQKDPKTYCWYILYKVYHFINEMYKIK